MTDLYFPVHSTHCHKERLFHRWNRCNISARKSKIQLFMQLQPSSYLLHRYSHSVGENSFGSAGGFEWPLKMWKTRLWFNPLYITLVQTFLSSKNMIYFHGVYQISVNSRHKVYLKMNEWMNDEKNVLHSEATLLVPVFGSSKVHLLGSAVQRMISSRRWTWHCLKVWVEVFCMLFLSHWANRNQ